MDRLKKLFPLSKKQKIFVCFLIPFFVTLIHIYIKEVIPKFKETTVIPQERNEDDSSVPPIESNPFVNAEIDFAETPYKEMMEILLYISQRNGELIDGDVSMLQSKCRILDATKCLSILTLEWRAFPRECFQRHFEAHKRNVFAALIGRFERLFYPLADETYYDLCEALAKGDDNQQLSIVDVLEIPFARTPEDRKAECVDRLVRFTPLSSMKANVRTLAGVHQKLGREYAVRLTRTLLQKENVREEQRTYLRKILYGREHPDTANQPIKVQ